MALLMLIVKNGTQQNRNTPETTTYIKLLIYRARFTNVGLCTIPIIIIIIIISTVFLNAPVTKLKLEHQCKHAKPYNCQFDKIGVLQLTKTSGKRRVLMLRLKCESLPGPYTSFLFLLSAVYRCPSVSVFYLFTVFILFYLKFSSDTHKTKHNNTHQHADTT